MRFLTLFLSRNIREAGKVHFHTEVKNNQINSKGRNLDNVHVKLNYLCFLVRETSSKVRSGLQGKLSPSVCWTMFSLNINEGR